MIQQYYFIGDGKSLRRVTRIEWERHREAQRQQAIFDAAAQEKFQRALEASPIFGKILDGVPQC